MSPLILAGYIVWVGKTIATGRSGVSGTAQGPLSARFSEHNFGTRPDEAADRLMRALPGVPRLGLRLAVGPVLLAHRLTGYVPRAFRYPFEGDVAPQYEASARIWFFDAAVDQYLPGAAQFVILGAGFDTRAYRLADGTRVRLFEVDSPRTQMVKRETLNKVGIDSSGVTFVPADFEKEDWLARLTAAGFDPGERTLFLWEGVTMYLDGAAVEDTLRKIASTAHGSVVAFDYFTTEPLKSRALYWRYGRATAKAAGEALKFGVDSTPPSRQRLAELLRSCGLSLSEQRTLGEDTQTRRAWGGFATAIVDSPPSPGACAPSYRLKARLTSLPASLARSPTCLALPPMRSARPSACSRRLFVARPSLCLARPLLTRDLLMIFSRKPNTSSAETAGPDPAPDSCTAWWGLLPRDSYFIHERRATLTAAVVALSCRCERATCWGIGWLPPDLLGYRLVATGCGRARR